jgi:uncharacterized protein (DUF1786 family)
VLFGINDGFRLGPTPTARRQNRAELKRALILRYGSADCVDSTVGIDSAIGGDLVACSATKLIIGDELARRMSDALILEEDICAVIQHCEETNQKLLIPETNRFVGHLKRGIITYWAVYAPDGEGRFILADAYSHRMIIEEDEE